MNHSNRTTTTLLTAALLACAWGNLPAQLRAAEPPAAQPEPPVAQRWFTSPEEAIKALQAATQSNDSASLLTIFGSDFRELLTGDSVEDANNDRKFADALAQGCNPVNDGADKIILEVGANNWPMPIPLVRAQGQWRFDTATGKEEVINRHIGKDELHAIGVCRAYVVAQRQYAKENGDGIGDTKYARKFKSTPGTKDGLYWPVTPNEPASPFGPLVAAAHAEGYGRAQGTDPRPFHGYYFRILTRQGAAAPGGKMNYLRHGDLTKGFALLAYPEHWDQSGIMSFIVNQDGQVYERNLGQANSRLAMAMKEYNPDRSWTPVPEDGVISAAKE